jgi:hypothetical protein
MMRTFASGALVCLALLVAVTQNIVGDCQGILGSDASELRIVLHIERSDGSLAGWPDREDRGANGIPVTAIVFETTNLTLLVDPINSTYAGRLNAAGTEIEGTTLSKRVPLKLRYTRVPWASKRR